MPRKSTLSVITPNKYYELEATLKYKHQTQGFTTAIIEEDNVQKKIKLPHSASHLEEGVKYCFQKCFYSKNGWLTVKGTDNIKPLQPNNMESLGLTQIYEQRSLLANNYLSTIAQVVEVNKAEKKLKDGKELSLTLIKLFAQNLMVDLTVWNKEISSDLVGKSILLEGVRLKLLTPNSLVLVTTVFTKITALEQPIGNHYDSTKTYKSLSHLYEERTIAEMQSDLSKNQLSHSIITAKISEASLFDYEGCASCHKKLQTETCANCGQGTAKGQFKVCQLIVKDQSGETQLFVFDQSLLGVLRYAKRQSLLTGKVKSSVRTQGEEQQVSHILVSIQSINF